MNFILEGMELGLKDILHPSKDGWRTREKRRGVGGVSRNYINTQEFAVVLYFRNICLSHGSLLSWRLMILGYVMTCEDIQSLWINVIYQHKGKLNRYLDWAVCFTYMFLQMFDRALGLLLCSKQIIFLNLATNSVMVVVRGATVDFSEKMKSGSNGSLLGILSCSEPRLMGASL